MNELQREFNQRKRSERLMNTIDSWICSMDKNTLNFRISRPPFSKYSKEMEYKLTINSRLPIVFYVNCYCNETDELKLDVQTQDKRTVATFTIIDENVAHEIAKDIIEIVSGM